MFSGFLIVSVVFTMFIAAAVWLPLLLALIEIIIRKQEAKGDQSFHPIPYVAAGAAVIGVMMLAGHPELIYYTLLVAGRIAWCACSSLGDIWLGEQFRNPRSKIRILKLGHVAARRWSSSASRLAGCNCCR